MTKRFNITIINNKPTCAELAGYELPECSRCQEDGVEKLSDASNGYLVFSSKAQGTKAMAFDEGFQYGYHKARERFEFTESDLRQAIALSLDDAEKSVIWSKEWYPNKLADKIIASLRTPRIPIAIEVEMVESTAYNAIRLQDESDCFGYYSPATNPDGTLKGRWVYE